MTGGPKCLVIDTDIASSAGGADAQEMRSTSCRDFLIAVKDTKHKIVTSETIRVEWHKHQSRFTRAWLVSMVAQRRVCWIDATADNELRYKVKQCTNNEKKREAMLKDVHLIEAALKSDKVVISMDETVRQHFHGATRRIGILKQIAWANPCKSEDAAIAWLQDGAELEKERLLGYRRESSEA